MDSTASGPTPKLSPTYQEFLRGVQALQVLQDRGQLVFGVEERSEAQGSPLPAGSVTVRDMVEAAKSGYEYRLDERGTAWTLFKQTPQRVLLLDPQAVGSAEMREITEVFRLSASAATSWAHAGQPWRWTRISFRCSVESCPR